MIYVLTGGTWQEADCRWNEETWFEDVGCLAMGWQNTYAFFQKNRYKQVFKRLELRRNEMLHS